MSNILAFMRAETHYQAQPTLGELCCNCRVVTMVIVKGSCKKVERNIYETQRKL